ncbi:hypothetical protein [Endozoicomonas elysicola]|uniref:hypothetical protein n=1 Tax=Endozoicomonas elysicola TaxID=305900 RepID=UPI00126901CF|nr:hypothetical protein [Endozoicomonas elysicola]
MTEHSWHTATQNDNDGHSLSETNASIRHQQTVPLDYQEKDLSPSNADSSPIQPNKDPITSHAPLPSEQVEKTSSPIEAENIHWQTMETAIQSGIEELANTVLPIPAQTSELFNADMECQDEVLENDLDNGAPLDVDAIDSDLNYQGFPLNRIPLDELSSSAYESGENYLTPDDAPSGKHHTDGLKHDSSLPLEEIYEQKLPVLKLSPEAYGWPSDISLDQKDDTPELLISLYPHGILQALLILYPATAIRIIKCRLEMLSTIDDTDLKELRENLRKVEDDIQNRNHHFALLRHLKAFENKYDLYSLQSKMDADFLVRKGRISSTLLATPVEEVESNKFKDPRFESFRTWPRLMGWWCKRREYILRGAIGRLGATKLARSRQQATAELEKSPLVRVLAARSDISKKDVLNQYIQEQPETIKRLLTYLVCFNVKRQRSLRKIQAAKIVLAADQLEQAPDSVRALLEKLVQPNLVPEIEQQLEDEIDWQHSKRFDYELKSFHPPDRLPELLDRRQQLLNIESLNHQRTNPPYKGDQGILVAQRNQASAQLIHLFLAAQLSSKGLPQKSPDLCPPWYFLKLPSTDHITTALAQPGEGPEKSFYKSLLKFIDALKNSTVDDSYEHDLYWLQCYHDVAYYQQQLLIHLIDKTDTHPLLPSNDFQQNIDVLWQLARARKNMGHRPLNPDSYAYYLSHLNFVWQEEESIEDSIAELYRKRYLKLLKYDPYEEFEALFKKAFQWGTAAWRSIYSNAEKLIQKLRHAGVSDSLNFLYQEGAGLISSLFSSGNPVYHLIRDTLSAMLEVAQQNPKFFRIMVGDFALLMPQLENLLGLRDPSITDLLHKIDVCMRGQALASTFTGDKPQLLDFNPAEHPERASFIKKFQFLMDFSAGCSKAIQIAQIIKVFLSKNASEFKSNIKNLTLNYCSTYVARQCVSHMKPPVIRLYSNLRYAEDIMPSMTLGLTSDFLASMSPEKTVRLAHHIGRSSSIVAGALNFLLDPLITRFDKYREKINNVKNNPFSTEARSDLQSERKKVAGILGISSVFSTTAILFINTFKIILFVSSPFLTTAFIGVSTFLCSGCFIARRYNKFDEVWTSISKAISEQKKRIFAKDSPKAIEARKRINEISKANLEKMSELREQDISGWRIWRENKRRIELSKYWDTLPYKNKEKLHQDIKTKIKEKHSDLKEDAQHIHILVQARTLIQNAMNNPDFNQWTADRLSDFNQQLAKLHFAPLDVASFPCVEAKINAFLECLCGTVCPGESVEAIMDTIESFNINLYKGGHLESVGHMKNLKSSFLHPGMAPDEQPAQQRPASGEPVEENPSLRFPDSHELQAIMENIELKSDEQWLERENQTQEKIMEMVTSQALQQSLEQGQEYTGSMVADVVGTPLFKANLEMKIKDFERAGIPQTVDVTPSSILNKDPAQPLHGLGYKVLEASKAFAGG